MKLTLSPTSLVAMSFMPAALSFMSKASVLPNGARKLSTGTGTRSLRASLTTVRTQAVDNLDVEMKYRKLGSSELVVSEVCLGTMTWGEQNTEAEAHEQLDLAFDQYGINFLDTAELYPVMPKPETQGDTDRCIASWLKKRGKSFRDDIVIATKVAGPSARTDFRDDGSPARVTRKQIIESVDKSLDRLGTDHIDLLQIHWPDRYVPLFGGPGYDMESEREAVSFEEQLRGLEEVVKAGKVRHVGVSNETPYGVCQFTSKAEQLNLPSICSIQNCYHLLNRIEYETNLIETCAPNQCDVGLLAYSPLAGGALTGKYLQDWDKVDEKARFKKFGGYMGRYNYPLCREAIKQYQELAEQHGMSVAELSLAYVYSRPFVTSTIIGATSTAQLAEDIKALNFVPLLAPRDLSEEERAAKANPFGPGVSTNEIIDRIEEIHRIYTEPMKAPMVELPYPAAVPAS